MAMLERQGEALKQNLDYLRSHLNDLLVAKETISSIKKAHPDQQMLFPIGGGCYAFGTLTDMEKVIVNIGSDVAVKEDIDKSLELMDKRINEARELVNQTSSSYSEVQQRMQELDQRGRQLMQQAQQQQQQRSSSQQQQQ
jgi:prefoldin alpha subunit